MTVIRPNSVSGINSITVQSGNSLAVHKANGELIRTIAGTTGVSTFSSISVGTAYTDNSAGKSINIGLGASISQHTDNSLSFGTVGDERLRIDSSGRLLLGTTIEGEPTADDLTIGSVNGTNDAGITVRTASSGTGRLFFSDGTSGAAEYQGYIQYNHSSGLLSLGSGGSTRLTIDDTGNVNVGTAATIKANGNATFSGIVTATSFKGDGSGLSGISAGTSLSGSTDNTVCTVTGANAIQGESNLTFDGSALAYSAGGSERFNLAHTSGGIVALKNPSNAALTFGTNNTERLRIGPSGGVGISTDKIRNADFLHIATQSQDFTNPTEELMDGGGICFQTIDNLASTGRSFPGIFWAPNTNELGRARAGILGVAASNNDATDIVFVGKYLPGGDGLYPRDERMRIKAQTGYVGINTAIPGRQLHIVGDDGPTQATSGNSDTILVLDNKGTNGAIVEFLAENNGAGRIMFTDTDASNQGQIEYTHSDDMMDIQSAGGFAVHVNGTEDAINASANGAVRLYFNNALKLETGSSHIWFYSSPLAANTSFDLGNSSSGRWGTMFSTATNVSSDISLKNSIATSDLGLDFINNLLPKSYKWNDTNLTQNPTYGLIAQDVEEALTKAGKTSDDFAGLDIPENGDPCGLDYLQFIAPLVKAVQELSTEVETLKTKVAALEGG